MIIPFPEENAEVRRGKQNDTGKVRQLPGSGNSAAAQDYSTLKPHPPRSLLLFSLSVMSDCLQPHGL